MDLVVAMPLTHFEESLIKRSFQIYELFRRQQSDLVESYESQIAELERHIQSLLRTIEDHEQIVTSYKRLLTDLELYERRKTEVVGTIIEAF